MNSRQNRDTQALSRHDFVETSATVHPNMSLPKYKFGDLPIRLVAVPGKTQLI